MFVVHTVPDILSGKRVGGLSVLIVREAINPKISVSSRAAENKSGYARSVRGANMEEYKYHSGHYTKTAANKEATYQRHQGYNAKLIQKGKQWHVYTKPGKNVTNYHY